MTMSHPTFDSPRRPSRLHALAAATRALVAGTVGLIFNSGGRGDGPPDLDELWRDFNRKLSGLFGGKSGGPRGNGSSGNGSGDGGNFQPDMRSAGIGAGLVAGVIALIWLAVFWAMR